MLARINPAGFIKTRSDGAQLVRLQRCHVITGAFVLKPTGDGSTDHLDGEPAKVYGPFHLKTGKHIVGRSDGADVQIPIITVSGRHAMIEVEGDKATITDLRSTNGTTVNGSELEPMEPMVLTAGADVIFGDVHLARYALEAAAEVASSDAASDAPKEAAATPAEEPKPTAAA